MTMAKNQQIFEIVRNQLQPVLKEAGVRGEINEETRIFGGGSPIESIQLVSLIIDIEDSIYDAFDLEITLADERAMSQERSPFRDVRSMVDYVATLVSS